MEVWQMPIPHYKLAVAVMVLNQENKVLLVKGRRRGWEFPGGYVGKGEAIRDAAIREVKEESGIDIQLIRFCGIDQDTARSTCIVLFEGTPIGGDLRISDESQEVGYFPTDEALKMFTWKSFKDRFIRCLHKEEHPFLAEI
jgi:8-oxo-dGTP diphosphatase